jgi:hypothetical protein
MNERGQTIGPAHPSRNGLRSSRAGRQAGTAFERLGTPTDRRGDDSACHATASTTRQRLSYSSARADG